MLRIVSAAAAGREARVVRVTVSVGELAGVMPDALLIAFDALKKDTPLAHAALVLEKVVLGKGRVRDAIRASVAIPYVWKPWKIDGRLLMDGCASDPLPIDVAIREGADVILAMGFESPYPSRIRSATRFAFQVNSVYTNNLLRANYAFHNLVHHAEIIPVLPDFGRPIRLFDTAEIPHVIEQGERATEAQLPHILQALGAVDV